MRRKKPKFERYEWRKKKALSKSWRKPRGRDNKVREHIAAKGPRVQVGYRRKKEERGLHPSGRREVLVFNPDEVAQVGETGEEIAVRIGSSVGRRKRESIEEQAANLGIKVLNPMQSPIQTPSE